MLTITTTGTLMQYTELELLTMHQRLSQELITTEALKERQDKHRQHENRIRQSRFRKGLSGLWDYLRGEHKRIQQQNEREAGVAMQRDRKERDTLIYSHLTERRHIKIFRYNILRKHEAMQEKLMRDRVDYGHPSSKTRGSIPEPGL